MGFDYLTAQVENSKLKYNTEMLWKKFSQYDGYFPPTFSDLISDLQNSAVDRNNNKLSITEFARILDIPTNALSKLRNLKTKETNFNPNEKYNKFVYNLLVSDKRTGAFIKNLNLESLEDDFPDIKNKATILFEEMKATTIDASDNPTTKIETPQTNRSFIPIENLDDFKERTNCDEKTKVGDISLIVKAIRAATKSEYSNKRMSQREFDMSNGNFSGFSTDIENDKHGVGMLKKLNRNDNLSIYLGLDELEDKHAGITGYVTESFDAAFQEKTQAVKATKVQQVIKSQETLREAEDNHSAHETPQSNSR